MLVVRVVVRRVEKSVHTVRNMLVCNSDADITKSVGALPSGKLVAFPTEAVYGLGANALNDTAAKRIFDVKGRPPMDRLICHVASIHKVKAYFFSL